MFAKWMTETATEDQALQGQLLLQRQVPCLILLGERSVTRWGAYGAGMSLYSHFIARGTEVVFPKNTPMAIGIGARKEGDAQQTPTVSVTLAGTEENNRQN